MSWTKSSWESLDEKGCSDGAKMVWSRDHATVQRLQILQCVRVSDLPHHLHRHDGHVMQRHVCHPPAEDSSCPLYRSGSRRGLFTVRTTTVGSL
jgi:hypothetical protein